MGQIFTKDDIPLYGLVWNETDFQVVYYIHS
jgi:hypothetical protein